MRADPDVLHCHISGNFEIDLIPDSQMDHARTEVPPVRHAALVRTHPACPSYLRLLGRRRADHHRKQVRLVVLQFVADLEGDGDVHPGMAAEELAVEVELRLVINALEHQPGSLPTVFTGNDDISLVHPSTLGSPLD